MDSLSKFSLLAVTLLTLSLSSCQKEKQTITKEVYKLPEISIEGKNKGGMLYNGKLFLFSALRKDGFTISETSNYINFDMFFISDSNQTSYQFFSIDNYTGIGKYELNRKNISNINFIAKNPTREESTTSQLAQYFDGYVNILRFDSTNKIISGVYEYTFQDSTVNNGDTVRVTNGRFDLKF